MNSKDKRADPRDEVKHRVSLATGEAQGLAACTVRCEKSVCFTQSQVLVSRFAERQETYE